MQVTGVREFRNRAPELVAGNDLVFITRHGKLAGILVPMKESPTLPAELRRELIERIGDAVSNHLAKRGVSERQALREFKAWRKGRRARSR
jgi:antitoxin (DNA-binding transcriptional repressor) of toxin-antitoxin stability system